MTSIITSVGYPGAGKSVLADVLENKGIPSVSMGDILRSKFEMADKEGKVKEQIEDYENKNKSTRLGQWATKQREINGSDVVAKWTTEYIKKELSSSVVFVDGLRSADELNVFEDQFDDVNVIYVEASRETRLERLQSRGRDGEGSFSMEDLIERDKREEDWGLKDIKNYVDFTIENEGTLEEFESEVIKILNRIQS